MAHAGYRLWCIVNGLVMLALFALGILGELRMKESCRTKRQKAFRIVLLVTAAVTIWNIYYWNLFMFWKIP